METTIKNENEIEDMGMFTVLGETVRVLNHAEKYRMEDLAYKAIEATNTLKRCINNCVASCSPKDWRTHKEIFIDDMKDKYVSAMEKAISVIDTMMLNQSAENPFKRHKYAKDVSFNRLATAVKKGLCEKAYATKRDDMYNEQNARAMLNNLWWFIYTVTNSNVYKIPAASDVRRAADCVSEIENYVFIPRHPDPEPEKPMRRAPNGVDELAFTEPTDIVITDTCYFVPDSDWQASGYGESLPFHHITKPTGVGDWDCAVISTDTGGSFGTFAADTGMCTVASLSDIKRAYPDAFRNVRRDCYAIIRGFTGVVRMTHGDVDGELIIIGNGNINFKTEITKQLKG